MPPWKAVLRGFFLAPLVPAALVFGVSGLFDTLVIPNATVADTLLQAAFVFVYVSIACYFIEAVFALPLYVLGWRFARVGLAACVICGALIGGGLLLVPFSLQYYGRAPNWDQETLGGVTLVDNGHFTAAGISNRLTGVEVSDLFGAAIGFCFWWAAIRGNPAAQARARLEGTGR
jgi:hypothetical protein